MQRAARMKKELQIIETSPPHGISCWAKDDDVSHLEASRYNAEIILNRLYIFLVTYSSICHTLCLVFNC